MRSRRGTCRIAVTAVLACTLAVATHAAIGASKSKYYEGDLTPSQEGGVYRVPSAIEFNVQFERNKGKLVPIAVRRFRSRSVTLYCPNGTAWWLGLHGEGVDFQDHPTRWVNVKKRKFHDASFDDYDFAHFEISGRLPRSGPATGTIRITAPNEAQGGTCDSGVVSWTAAKQG
jgi:hypothetical protein